MQFVLSVHYFPTIVVGVHTDWEYGMFPISTSDTPVDMKDYGAGPGLAPNDPIYTQMYPNVRKHFVEEGMYMNRHYAASVCSPSRKQLLSGRSVWSQGNGDWLPIRPRYSLISDKLKQANYTNHFVVKWYAFESKFTRSHCHVAYTHAFVVSTGTSATFRVAAGPRTADLTRRGGFIFQESGISMNGNLPIKVSNIRVAMKDTI